MSSQPLWRQRSSRHLMTFFTRRVSHKRSLLQNGGYEGVMYMNILMASLGKVKSVIIFYFREQWLLYCFMTYSCFKLIQTFIPDLYHVSFFYWFSINQVSELTAKITQQRLSGHQMFCDCSVWQMHWPANQWPLSERQLTEKYQK